MKANQQAIPLYQPNPQRYEHLQYRRCGRSGLLLPAISLGLWHNFGHANNFTNARQMLRTSFDLGITHFDLANNYGPPYGSAEETFGRILKQDFMGFRDELLISTKAGWDMWDGPYGNFGSKKYLVASIDQSLKRMGLDYVDIFYHHRPDPETPLEETMEALHHIVQQGKALYVGVSSYPTELLLEAHSILRKMGTKLLIHQPRYNMFNRWVEATLLDTLETLGIGSIAFSPLAQGLLTDKYLNGIPDNSRAGKDQRYLNKTHITPEVINKAERLNAIANQRGQKLAQMAISWLLKDQRVTSVLIGASSPEQIIENVAALDNLEFTADELAAIEAVLK